MAQLARRHHLAASLPRRSPGVGGRGRGRAAPGRSCSGGTPISAASADGRWAPARPPPLAAQWARSLRRTMRPGPRTCSQSRGALAGPVRPRPRRVSLGRARPTADARPAGLRGGTRRPAAHCSRPPAGAGLGLQHRARSGLLPGPPLGAPSAGPPRLLRACAPLRPGSPQRPQFFPVPRRPCTPGRPGPPQSSSAAGPPRCPRTA